MRKEDVAPVVEMVEEAVAALPEAALEPVEAPAVSSTQPLWLQQNNLEADMSSFAPRIVVVGVGGAGGNAGECGRASVGAQLRD